MGIWIAAASATLLGGVGLRLAYLRWRHRRVAAKRVVEKPNSHYSSRGVRALEDRERWRSIDVGRLHPVNREEVVRLLDAVDREGVGCLSPSERLFLDNMTR